MTDVESSLNSIFLKIGEKNGLNEDLLNDVFNLLMEYQYTTDGNRDLVKGQITKILKF
jgi:hypothetical protein